MGKISIIGAGSVVTSDIPDNSVAVGIPARVISSLDDYLNKEKSRMENAPVYGEGFTLRGNVSMEKRMQQKQELDGKIGYID